MSGLLFAGCLFLAYGPAFIIILSIIAPRSYLFILLTLRYRVHGRGVLASLQR